MNSLEQFNKIYATEKAPAFSPSLIAFFNSQVAPRISSSSKNSKNIEILDLGCGSKSIFEEIVLANEKMSVTAVDFSSMAIAKAKHGLVNYQLKDLTHPNAFIENSFDVIFDSHCLHCIEGEKDREMAFLNIYKALKSDGIIAFEMMVQPTGMTVNLPMKYIGLAMELEGELLRHGFKIIYFMIVRELSFESPDGICDLLRVIAKK